MFGSCCVPFSKKREMETRSDCARRRRVGLAADMQFVVKLSGECRGKWLDICFGVAMVRCTPTRERFVVAVVVSFPEILYTYRQVITANRPGPWPCHERYADKQITPKARHNSNDEVPYEKTKVLANYPGNYAILY